MAARAAKELEDGFYVNLGIGIPTLVANHIPAGVQVTLQSENGMLGIGPFPLDGEEDADLINAGKQTISELPQTAYFSSSDSFAMIRGGHIDVCILGAYEVTCAGDIANWSTGDRGTPAVGGAMDLVAGAREVRVIMSHRSRNGAPKLIGDLTLPATGRAVVKRIYTELGVLDPIGDAFRLVELAPGVDEATLRDATGAKVVA